MEISRENWAVGFDQSFKMLVQAQNRLRHSGKLATLVQGDALSLPFPSNYFSAVFMAFTLELMDTPEIPCVFNEFRRILQPSGRLGIVSLSKLSGMYFMKRLYEWSHALFPEVVDCRPIYARYALEKAGFKIIDYRILSSTGLGIEAVICQPQISA
jgi:ubiquinone/menaquinone biosynthesis C-methylase UbiE